MLNNFGYTMIEMIFVLSITCILASLTLNYHVDLSSYKFRMIKELCYQAQFDSYYNKKVNLEIQKEKISNIEENTIENDMPDAFWITQSDDTDKVNNEEGVLSFDEQINVLLANEENTKIKKLVA